MHFPYIVAWQPYTLLTTRVTYSYMGHTVFVKCRENKIYLTTARYNFRVTHILTQIQLVHFFALNFFQDKFFFLLQTIIFFVKKALKKVFSDNN